MTRNRPLKRKHPGTAAVRTGSFALLILCLWIHPAAVQAAGGTDTETLKAAAAAPVSQFDSDSDVVLVDEVIRIQYQADGTDRYDCDAAFKILTEKGRQEKSTVRLGYSAAYGSVSFTAARIFRPDGSVTDIDLTTQVREAIEQGQMEANIFDPSHKTICLTVPGLTAGDVLQYRFSGERTKAVVPGTWSDSFTLEDVYPVRRAVYEIDAPASLPLVRIELKDEIPGTVAFRKEETGGRIRYRWEVRDVPRMFEEPGMPQRHTVVQRLLVSTIPDWETLSRWYWELSLPRLEAVHPAMSAKVEQLTAGRTRQEQIESVFRFVSQDIRYMGITIEDEAPGYEPHDVSLTFDNRYGVCRDKAALLAAMLRMAGFDARPVLIYVGPKKDPAVPQPWFNHAITGVRNEDGSWLLMDATNENTRDILPAYLSNRSYLVATPGGETLQTSAVVPPGENMLTIEADAALDEEWLITGEARLQFSGINDTAYRGRLAALKPEERVPYFEERLKQAFSGASLTRLDIQPADVRDTTVPLSVTLRFEIRNALVAGPDHSILQVPTFINQFGLFGRLLGDGISLDQRRYPLYTEVTCGVTETVRLDLGRSGLRPAALPAYETADDERLLIRREVAAEGNRLISRADLQLRTVEFSPEEYRTLKQHLQAAGRNARKRVILSADGFAGADLAVLNEDMVVAFNDRGDWTETRTVRIKVLSYAGKKEASDLKFTYNPAWQDLELTRASVTAPDGTVQHIDPAKEINHMDAKWTGEAPRYPAEKILVASLPGVEAGSIIEYTVTASCRGMPFFSAVEPFAGHHPVARKTVRIEAPHGMKFDTLVTDPGAVRQRTWHQDGKTVYEWQIENRRAIRKEDRLPPEWVSRPALLVSNGELKRYAAETEKVLLQAARENKAAAVQARRLTAGLKSGLEKITVLRDFTDRSIRAAGPAFPALPLSAVTPADEVLAAGYGHSADRAVVLYALLDAAGFKPRFVLASGLPQSEDLSAPAAVVLQRNWFDTVLVAVETGGTVFYLGDSGQYAQPGTLEHAGRPALDLRARKLVTLPDPLPDATETVFQLSVQESGDVLLRKRSFFYGMEFETFHKLFAQFTPEQRKREHQKMLSRISQSAAADGDLITEYRHPGRLEFQARLPLYAVREGDFLYVTLPEANGDLPALKSTRRDNPYYIEKPVRRTTRYEIELPDGWEPALMPETARFDLPADGGFARISAVRQDNRIVIMRQVELRPTLIPAGEYARLLQAHEGLNSPAAQTLLLRKIRPNPVENR